MMKPSDADAAGRAQTRAHKQGTCGVWCVDRGELEEVGGAVGDEVLEVSTQHLALFPPGLHMHLLSRVQAASCA
eukprot:1720295-Rhodomonas_salina.1